MWFNSENPELFIYTSKEKFHFEQIFILETQKIVNKEIFIYQKAAVDPMNISYVGLKLYCEFKSLRITN